MDTAGAKSVSEGKTDVIAGCDLADLLKMLIEEALLPLSCTPASHDRSPTTDDPCETAKREVDMLPA